jgi:uncharacterized membrane protein
VGILLRFTHLDLKPLWTDELLTALFASGRSPIDLPLDVVFAPADIATLLAFEPTETCPQIAATVARESTHPPLFFCLMHGWLRWLQPLSASLAWQLRSLPAVLGVGAIAAMYALNRVAFSPAAGLAAAALMAVSPFCVYLSQEARHYTLPMLLITLALLGLVQIQARWWQGQRISIGLWLGWVLVNSLGLYVHYFFLLVYVAQLATLLTGWTWMKMGRLKPQQPDQNPSARVEAAMSPRRRTSFLSARILFARLMGRLKPQQPDRNPPARVESAMSPRRRTSFLSARILFARLMGRLKPQQPIAAYFPSILPLLVFLPWLPTLLAHFSRPETDWFKPFEPSWTDGFAPLYQTVASWLLMVVALPVEGQPLAIALPMGILMLGFGLGSIWQLWRSIEKHRSIGVNPVSLPALTLLGFTLWVLLEILVMAYGLGKDITAAPRYHFIYYPSLCALLGALLSWGEGGGSIAQSKPLLARIRSPLSIAVCVGLVSSLCVIYNGAFLKPYYPDRVAKTMAIDPSLPMVAIVGYENVQEVALGLSFFREIDRQNPTRPIKFAFLNRSRGYTAIWQTLDRLPALPSPPLNLWIVAPGLRKAEYPPSLQLHDSQKRSTTCIQDRSSYYRIGVPYQLYRCPR